MAQVTTASLPALQKYKAMHAMNIERDIDKAIPLYKKAVALDLQISRRRIGRSPSRSKLRRTVAPTVTPRSNARTAPITFQEAGTCVGTSCRSTDRVKARAAALKGCSPEVADAVCPRSTTSRLSGTRTKLPGARGLLRMVHHLEPVALTAYNNLLQYQPSRRYHPAEGTFKQGLKMSRATRVAMDHVVLWSRGAFDVAAAFADSVSRHKSGAARFGRRAKINVEKAVAHARSRARALRLDGEGAKLLEKRRCRDRTLATDSAMVALRMVSR